jgi:hypothetical protein
MLAATEMPSLRSIWSSKGDDCVIVFDARDIDKPRRKALSHVFSRARADFFPYAIIGAKKLHGKPGGLEASTPRSTSAILFLDLAAGASDRCPVTLWHCPTRSAEDAHRIAADLGDVRLRPV